MKNSLLSPNDSIGYVDSTKTPKEQPSFPPFPVFGNVDLIGRVGDRAIVLD